jgi:hypothetical protein
MWRKGKAKRIKNIFHGIQIFDSQLSSSATIATHLRNKSDFTGTKEYLNQMYS